MDSNIILESIKNCKNDLEYTKHDHKTFNKNNTKSIKPIVYKLCEFMDISYNIHKSNIEVTQYILNYIELNSLQSRLNKKYIIPEDKLKNLFNIQDDSEITYFNIQKYIKYLFIT